MADKDVGSFFEKVGVNEMRGVFWIIENQLLAVPFAERMQY